MSAALVTCGFLLGVASPVQAAAGELDPGFGDGGRVTTDFGSRGDFGLALAIQPDGKIVAVGNSSAASLFNVDFALSRYNPDGSLDPAFGSGGTVLSDLGSPVDAAFDVVVQPDGKIVAAGVSGGDFAVARYDTSGSLDGTFASGGVAKTDFGSSDQATALVLQADSKIVATGLTGSSNNFALARYNSDGTLDATFGSGGKVTTDFGSFDVALDVAITTGDKIVVDGRTGEDFALARYDANGSLDGSFGNGGKVTTDFDGSDQAFAIAVDPGGRVTAAGAASGDFALARYNPDGSLDQSFGTGGKVTTDFSSGFDAAHGLIVQPDGGITTAGSSSSAPGSSSFALARYTSSGSLDAGFGSGGKVTTTFGHPNNVGWDIAAQPDGKIVAAGGTSEPSGISDFTLARYLGGPEETIAPAFLQWSVDGQPVGTESRAPERARDLEVAWKGDVTRAVIVWTKDGKVNSSAITSPAGANDFRVVWARLATRFSTAFWTRGGVDLEPIPIAPGSNGLYLKLSRGGVFDNAFWTNRKHNPIEEITPEPGASDLRLELKSARRFAGTGR